MLRFKLTCVSAAVVVLLAVFTLTAADADYKWPAGNDNPPPRLKGEDARKVLTERWNKASKEPLGTHADTAAIEKTIFAHVKMNNPNAKVREVRWLSPTSVMAKASWVYGDLASARYFYVLQKTKDKWRIVTYYMLGSS